MVFEVSFFFLRFHEALLKYGVNKVDMFQTNDLAEKKDIAAVVNTICALGRAVGWGRGGKAEKEEEKILKALCLPNIYFLPDLF